MNKEIKSLKTNKLIIDLQKDSVLQKIVCRTIAIQDARNKNYLSENDVFTPESFLDYKKLFRLFDKFDYYSNLFATQGISRFSLGNVELNINRKKLTQRKIYFGILFLPFFCQEIVYSPLKSFLTRLKLQESCGYIIKITLLTYGNGIGKDMAKIEIIVDLLDAELQEILFVDPFNSEISKLQVMLHNWNYL